MSASPPAANGLHNWLPGPGEATIIDGTRIVAIACDSGAYYRLDPPETPRACFAEGRLIAAHMRLVRSFVTQEAVRPSTRTETPTRPAPVPASSRPPGRDLERIFLETASGATPGRQVRSRRPIADAAVGRFDAQHQAPA